MLFKSFAVAAIASIASAEVIFMTNTQQLSLDNTQASKFLSAIETYATHLTAQPEYTSYVEALSEYVATRTDAPSAAILGSEATTMTNIPAWYSGLPDDVKKYGESIAAERNEILSSIADGAAAKPTGMAHYVGAGVAAAAAGAAVLL